MFFALSKTLDLALDPLAWVIVLVAIAAVLLVRRSPRRGVIIGALAAAVGVALVAGNPMVANRLWWSLESDAPDTHRRDIEYDAVVLLGGLVANGYGWRDETAPFGDGIERLLVTYDLLRRDRAAMAVLTGGAPDVPQGAIPEGSVLAAQLEDWGVEGSRLIVDDTALNTRQNATVVANVARDRGLERLLVVTSAFHMPRAIGCFRVAGLSVDALPVDRRAVDPRHHPWRWSPRSSAFERTTEALRELAGRVVYRLQGYSD